MTIIQFPSTSNAQEELPPNYDELLRECIRTNKSSKKIVDACQYFPRLDSVMQNIARHILTIPYEKGTLLTQCINAAIGASLILKNRPFLSKNSEEIAYISIIYAMMKYLTFLQRIEVAFFKGESRQEWNPLDHALYDHWARCKTPPEYRLRPDWFKTEMTANDDQFVRMIATRVLSSRDVILFYDYNPKSQEFV